ncbi:MAG: DUF4080 domain-containing protein, partial [Oscillospiraceae bacterium]
AFELRPHMLQLGFLKLLYGSRLRHDSEKYGYIYSDYPPYEITESRWISKDELSRIHRAEDVLERTYNSRRFMLTIDKLLEIGGITPYELFLKLGDEIEVNMISLDDYTKLLRCAAKKLFDIDLRDVLVCDRLCSGNTGKIPKDLQIEDIRLGSIKRKIKESGEYGNKFAVAILYDKKVRVAVADYRKKDKISGRYALKILPINMINT